MTSVGKKKNRNENLVQQRIVNSKPAANFNETGPRKNVTESEFLVLLMLAAWSHPFSLGDLKQLRLEVLRPALRHFVIYLVRREYVWQMLDTEYNIKSQAVLLLTPI